VKQETRPQALKILQDPRRYLPLLFTTYSIDPDTQLADWLAASLGDEAEMLVKRLLVEGFYQTEEPDLIAYARRRVLEEILRE
jgi:hypothetical protein